MKWPPFRGRYLEAFSLIKMFIILIKILIKKFVPKGPIDSNPAFV